MHHYCKKAIAVKKLILKRSDLHLGNDIRWLDLRSHGQRYARGGEGKHWKIYAKRTRMLSQRSCCISTTIYKLSR